MSTSPIVITPSTSVVLVNTADYSGNPVVLLPNLAGPGALGRIITVRDNDGGSVNPGKSIYLSTTGGARFQSELSSITLSSFRITQPYGFITITPRLNDGLGNTNYGLMNVYAFPEASPAAYVNTFNTNFGYISTLSTINLAVNQNTLIAGNLTVGGSITYASPGTTTLDIGRVNTNLLSAATVLNSNFYGVNVGASTINTSTFVVRDSGSVLLPNAGTWSNAAAFAGTADPNSLTLGNPTGSAGAQIGLSSNFFGLRSFSVDGGTNKFSTTVVLRDGTVGVNVSAINDIGSTKTSNFPFYVRGGVQLSNLGVNNNIGMLKTSAVDVSYVEVAQFGVGVGSASNYRIDTSSNITEGFFGPAFTDQYNWLTVNKNGSIKFWTGNSGTTERVTIDNIGRVGIGTTTPPHPLSVNGNIRMMSNNSLIYGTATDTSQQASLNLCSNDNKTYLNYGSGGAFNVCDNNGSQRFYVYDNAAGFIQYDTDTSGQIASLNLANSPGATAKSLRFHTNLGVGNYNSITQEGDKGIFFTNGIVDSGNLVIAPWASAPAKGIRMDSAGRVGIGTSNPQALIDIYYGAGSTGSDGSNQIAFQWNSGGYRHFIRSRHDSAIGSSSNALDFFLNNSTSSSASTGPGTGNTLGMSITANGVGVGRTPGSTYALDVSGGDIRVTNNGANSILDLTSVGGTLSIRRSSGTNGNTDILNFGSGSFNIYTNITTSPCMTINSSGNVGIGTEGSVNSAAKVLIGNDLCIARGSSGTADDGGAISFVTYSGRTNEPMSQIKGILINQTGSEQQGGISFSTRPFGTAGQVMTERMRIKSDGSVGIGNTPDSTYKLDVTGKIRATDDIIAFSDERVKKNIYTIENALEKIRNLRGVCYTPIDSSVKKIGVIAQEIEKILPEVVSTDSSPDQYKSVAYGNIVALLIEGIKELAAKVDALEGKI